jgi:hypothetical protein
LSRSIVAKTRARSSSPRRPGLASPMARST